MIDDVKGIIEKGIHSLSDAIPEIRKLSSYKNWKKREDAATALVEISKKKEEDIIREMLIWADDENPNIRRAASEGLRGVARRNPEKVLPVIVFNPGGLVKWLKPEEFGTISKTRNPIIALLLSRTIFVEKLGTGINRIKKAMKLSNLPNPEFKFYEHSFYANLFDRTMIKGIATEPLKATPKLKQEFEKLGENQIKIIYFMKKDKFITIIKLSDKLDISTTAIEKDIKKLKAEGIIKRIGPAKGGHWEVRE